ncbi:MAG: type II and III secretion system protein family protein [Nitratireductor sp.]
MTRKTQKTAAIQKLKGTNMLKKVSLTTAAIALSATMTATLPNANLEFPSAHAGDNKNYIKISKHAIGKTQKITVGLNKSMVIDLPAAAHDILVANPEVADAVTRTSKRIYLFAKQVGETNLFIFDAAGNQLLSLDLKIERDVDGLDEYLAKYIPNSDIKVEIVNDNIILTGSVPTPQSAAKAVELATIFVKGGAATTPGAEALSTEGSGFAIDFGNDEERVSQIVNLLKIDAEDQVTLKVTIAEIQRTIVKQLGIDLSGAGGLGGLTASIFGDNPLSLGKAVSHSQLSLSGSHGGNNVRGLIRALNQAGVMRTLAEPSLTAISGEPASFKVGGTYNVADGKDESIGDDGGCEVTYEARQVEYGVGLDFTPVVLSPGRISLKIATEVSEPTTEGSFTIPSGCAPSVTMPGIRTRQASTTVELPSGGSMVIAGLLKDDVRQTISGFPGLSKIPIIGTLFRSREFQRYESELVIIVTPYLVRPVARQALARPDDNFNAAQDSAGMFLGRVNKIYGTVEGNLPKGKYHGNPGFIFK